MDRIFYAVKIASDLNYTEQLLKAGLRNICVLSHATPCIKNQNRRTEFSLNNSPF